MEKTLKTSFGVAMQTTRRDNFYGKEWFSLPNTTVLNFYYKSYWVLKLYYKHYLLFLYYCCFPCFVSILRLARPEVLLKIFLKFMKLTLSYSVYLVISACTHPCDTNTFTQSHKNTFIAAKNP